jgi:uncharacterized protein (TIGR03437 family)
MRYRGALIARFAVSAAAVFAAASGRADLSTGATAPFYTVAGVVNAATQTAGALAPNTIASLYGVNLSWTTRAVGPSDLNNGVLPTSLEGVTVFVHGIPSCLFYVSPGQINFLIPYELTTLAADITVLRQGVAGPDVTIQLAPASPGLFEWNGPFALAEHADGSLITADSPAQAGEVVVLYAAGLGRVLPDSTSGSVPLGAATIFWISQFQILLDGVPQPAASLFYAGVAPGFAGLYQINFKLPDQVFPDPEIRIVIGSQWSPALVRLRAH